LGLPHRMIFFTCKEPCEITGGKAQINLQKKSGAWN
jgi:hypothetical protein